MVLLLAVLLMGDRIVTVPSADFPKEQQVRAVTATVRIENRMQDLAGSGVVVGTDDKFLYILTAAHVVDRAQRVEVQTFSATSYPEPETVYRSGRVVAVSRGIRDLALVRVATHDRPPGMLRVCPPGALPKEKELPILGVGCEDGSAPTCRVDTATKKPVRRTDGESGVLWETTRGSAEGCSGGPLVDRRGYLVGICSGANNGRGYHSAVEALHAFLKEQDLSRLVEELP
jgi:S1-C subfamily serine protease